MPGAELAGRVAWVTGGGSGIGQAGAAELAGAGATVIVSGRRPEALEETLKLVAAAGGKAEKLALDVADKNQVAAAAKELLARHGRCDVLVNSAGLNVPQRYYKDLTPEAWDKVIGINLNGALYCITAVLPAMRAQKGGLVVNVSSWLGRWVGYLGGAAYGASKHALATLTHHLNLEEGMHGIRGCVIYPGEVATPILKSRPVPPSQADLERMLKPEDLGRAIRFVATLPPHVCVNELVITPTWNRLYLGGKELSLGPKMGSE
jgi:NADP-dependent 3-hydroxy acid dehydrogenase YdfG